MRTSKPFIKNRNKLGASKPIFVHNLVAGNSLKDIISQTDSTTSISGTRWGIVNGVVSSFASNVPPIEDKGLRGCPAFTQKNLYSYAYSNWSKGSNVVLSDGLDSPIQPGIKSAKYNLVANTLRTIATSTITENANGKTYRISFWIKAIVDTTIITEFRSSSGPLYTPSTSLLVSNGWNRLSVMYTYASDTTNHFVYIYDNSGGVGDRFYITDINYTEGISLLPSVPTNGSSISVVSEAATATTGTSFDLDAATLTNLKKGLRGTAVGAELTNPTNVGTQNIDANNYTSAVGVGAVVEGDSECLAYCYACSYIGSCVSTIVYSDSNISSIFSNSQSPYKNRVSNSKYWIINYPCSW